jgi:amino acid adenylation domain-containing protein
MSYLRHLDVRLVVDGKRLHVNAPKGMLTEKLRSQIDERKAELLAFLRDQAFPSSFGLPPIPRRVSKDSAPLSFAQERLWFLEQLEPGSAVYNLCRASRLTGELNVAALEKSLTEIVRRHEILRSQIRSIDGRPMQVTAAAAELKLRFSDLRSLKGSTLKDEIRCQSRAEVEQQFDFSAGLLLRALLLRIGDEKHILILTTHHIVSDAWSMGILTWELWTLYDAYSNGRPSPLQDLAVQYADYALWQREWLEGEVLESQLSYWRQQLENLAVLNLPTDHARPAKQSFRGARQSVMLTERLTANLKELSRREGVTLFMVLLATLQTLLYRYTGQEDIVVGSPIANRSRTDLEGLVGVFVNTLALRTALSGKPTFRELLSRVRDLCLGAYAHQDLPFEKLVEELQPERDLSRNPLFQVTFILQNAPRGLPNISGISLGRMEVDSRTSKFDLNLSLAERERRLTGFFEYSTELFDRSTIERMIGHFQTLLEGIVADPDQCISTLPLLTEPERHQLLVEWNSTEADYPKDSCIHELFETQVERNPDAIAVEFEGKQLTYRELNSRANQLAHYLQAFGVGPEKVVGIYIERSLEMVVSLLGVLKAGGVYMPLDPAYPKERLEFMSDDAQVSVLLTRAKLVEDRGWTLADDSLQSSSVEPRFMIVCLDRDWRTISQQRDHNPKPSVRSENLAYVIYTSGSTGHPKGVQVSHRSVVNCLCALGDRIGLSAQDIWLGVTTISFDIAALEIFLPLITGAKVVLASRTESLDGIELSKRLKSCGATVMQATPTSWNMLLDAGWEGSPEFKVLCGGETLSRRLAERLTQSGAPVWNLYGPTETTIWSTMYSVEPGVFPVYIGRPIANTQIYILDAHMQPVPIGVHGDLYIGGAGLARGYMNREELTAERFIHNPFSDDPESRLYRTGDRARRRPDGNIEFLGRSDNQVKIRGHRIELGEIEATLNQHPSIKETVVLTVNNGSSDSENPKSKTHTEHGRSIDNPKSLVAYIVSDDEQLKNSELRNFLNQKLPEYIIPSTFVFLNALPLAPNGKVDRKRLPRLDSHRAEVRKKLIPPHTAIEELIAEVWKDVLRGKEIGVHESFFELGGHSLLAVQIVSRLRNALNCEIPLRVLFEAPTIAGLAENIEKIIREWHEPELPPIVAIPRDGPVPLSMNQEQLWILDQTIPGSHFFNMPYVYRISGELNIAPLEKSLKEIIRRHEALRTVFAEVEGKPVQVVKSACEFQLPIVDLRSLPPGDVEQQAAGLILEERERPFYLATGPLLRTRLLRLTDHEHLLLVTTHHIISDHWSMRIFRGELLALYEAFSHGWSSPLPEPAIQFADYTSWERRLLDGGLLNTQLTFWKEQLAGFPPQLEFQKGGKPRKEANFRMARQRLELDEALFTGIKGFARRENSTPFMVLVAALNILLYRYTGQRDICIGALVANRGRRETEGTIGHFVNTVTLCTHLAPEMTVKQLLTQVQRATLLAYAHQELPFEQLARILERDRTIDRGPLFQVLLNYQHHHFESSQIAGLTFAPLDLQQSKEDSDLIFTTFDLIFTASEMSTTLTGCVNYKTNVIGEEDVKSMLESFTKLLGNLTAHPAEQIASILADGVL